MNYIVPTKSLLDDRNYKVFALPNKLKVILVSDSNTDKAAASLQVNVGQFDDTLPGIAHFLEHMLFMGTEKYTDENSYSAFLSMNGGSSNAYTANEHTNYHFNVKYDKLDEALDRFCSFFISPLLTQSATDRELNAVHNEYSKNLNSDAWRKYFLLKSHASKESPFSKFGSGNMETLGESVSREVLRQELMEVFKLYSSEKMTLSIIGRESLEKLEEYSLRFAEIVCKNAPVRAQLENHFDSTFAEKMDLYNPVKDSRSITFSYKFPSLECYYETQPLSLIGHCIGHEGNGSILALLKSYNWATGLSAGSSLNESEFSIFSVGIELTELGLTKIENIRHILNLYISKLSLLGSNNWKSIFDEVREIGDMNFKFKSKEKPISYATFLANCLHLYPPELVLTAPHICSKFDYTLLLNMLGYLNESNCFILLSRKGDFELKEKWSGAEYTTIQKPVLPEIGVNFSSEISASLFPPLKNPFIADNFTIYSKEIEVVSKENGAIPPTLIHSTDHMNVYYKLDSIFSKPKANVIISMIIPSYSPLQSVLDSLLVSLVTDSLNIFAYDADIAGLSYKLLSASTGFQIILGGYNQKLNILAKKVIETLKNYKVDAEKFNIQKEKMLRNLRNFEKEQPYNHALFNIMVSLESSRWHRLDKINALEGSSPSDLTDYLSSVFNNIYFECLFHGNLLKEESISFAEDILKIFPGKPLPKSMFPEKRMVKLSPGYWYLHQSQGLNLEDENSSVAAYFQFGINTIETYAVASLFAHICKEPCFNTLRTIEQLGYLVFSGLQDDDTYNTLGFKIIVQSGDKSADYLDIRVDAFIESILELLKNMSDQDFSSNVDAVVANKLESDKTLHDETKRHWSKIGNRRYEFGREYLEAKVIKSLTKENVIDFYNLYVCANAPNRCKFSAQTFGNKQAVPTRVNDKMVILVDNEITFRRSMPLFPSCL